MKSNKVKENFIVVFFVSLGMLLVMGIMIFAQPALAQQPENAAINGVPPSIDNFNPASSIAVGETFSYPLELSGDAVLTYTLSNQPAGMGVDGFGVITWSPTDVQVGAHSNIVILVENNDGSDSETFSLQVNSAPQITSLEPTHDAVVGEVYTHTVTVSAEPAVTFSIDAPIPTGMQIDPNLGDISWIPTALGDKTITVRASNGVNPDATQTFTIPVGEKPQLNTIFDKQLSVGDSFNTTAVATGSTPMTYTLQSAPSSMSIGINSGVISWVASATRVGINEITVVASNKFGSTYTTFDLFVQSTAICLADTISYWPSDAITGNQSVDMIWSNNAVCTKCPTVAPGKVNNALNFDGLNDGLGVQNPSNLHLAADASFSIQAWINTTQTCKGDENKVVVGSRRGGTEEYWWLGCGFDNNETVFEVRGIGPVETYHKLQGTTAINDGQWHHVAVTRDESVDEYRLYVDGIVEASKVVNHIMPINDNAPLYMGYFGTSYYFDGLIDEVSIQDSALSSTQIAQYATNANANVGACSATAVPPTITSTAVTQGVINTPYAYDVEASGIPAPTYSLLTPPTGMSINPTTGLISWTPTPGQAGQNAVEVQASNSAGSPTQAFIVDVATQSVPEITSTPVTEAILSSQYSYDVDAKGQPAPTYSFANTTPIGGMNIDTNTGLITWDVPSNQPEGLVNIIIKATNIAGEHTQTFDIEIKKNQIFLPAIMKPSPPSFPLLIGYAIPKEPVVKGETFYSIKLVLPSTIPATGQFFLSTKPDQVTPVVVDDEFVITLGGNELFTKRFSSNCQPVQEETVELPRTLLEQLVGKTSTFSYRDVCGNFVKASTIWLIWRS